MKYKSYYLLLGWHLVYKKRYPIGVRLMLFDDPGIRINCGTLDFCATLDSDQVLFTEGLVLYFMEICKCKDVLFRLNCLEIC